MCIRDSRITPQGESVMFVIRAGSLHIFRAFLRDDALLHSGIEAIIHMHHHIFCKVGGGDLHSSGGGENRGAV